MNANTPANAAPAAPFRPKLKHALSYVLMDAMIGNLNAYNADPDACHAARDAREIARLPLEDESDIIEFGMPTS